MAAIRLQYDLLHNTPFVVGTDDSQMPSNVAPDALALNVGTSSYPIRSASSGNVVNIRGRFSHTSGDARNIYNRMYLYGSSGGEAFRCFTSVMANLTTARGAHISLNFDATAGGSECSGTGTPLTCTLHIPNIASWEPTGTLYGAQIQIYSDGANSDPAGLTALAGLCVENAGNATGKADVDTDAFIFDFQGWTAAADTTKAVSSVSLAELPGSTIGLRVRVDSTTYYIPCVAATEWN